MKLQDAFISETGTNYGSWKFIGYTMKTSNNVFDYKELTLKDSETGVLSSSAAEVWQATPVAPLNECKTTDTWKLAIKTASSGNGAGYVAKVSSDDCNVLVPGFGKLDETGKVTP